MSGYNKSYSDYLGKKKCCCKGATGTTGATGATGGSPWSDRNAPGYSNATYTGAGYTGTGYTGDVIVNGNMLVTGATGDVFLNPIGNIILGPTGTNSNVIFTDNLLYDTAGPLLVNKYLRIFIGDTPYKIPLHLDTDP